MWRLRQRTAASLTALRVRRMVRRFVLSLAGIFFASGFCPITSALSPRSNFNDDKNLHPPTVRWSEAQPGCTFSRDDDGKYRYGVWSGDIGVILAVDAREVQIIRHRIEPIFGVLLTVRYRGAEGLDANPNNVTLQFEKHFNVVQPSLDPDSYVQKIQA